MTDPRTTPANGRVAASFLQGEVEAPSYVDGDMMQCAAAAADVMGKPGGRRTSQLLFGDQFLVLEVRDGHVFGQTVHDGYCGYVRADLMARARSATHWVVAPQTHLYPGANMKLTAEGALYLGSEVIVQEAERDWSKLSNNLYVPSGHLLPVKTRLDDPVGVADLFLGTPYFWGGGTRYGIDCSGLVQIAWRACGLDCPRDSDMQEAEIGRRLEHGETPQRGDLAFWKGHVGIMTEPDMMLHANAFHMAVAYEKLSDATARIAAAGDGPPSCIKRPDIAG